MFCELAFCTGTLFFFFFSLFALLGSMNKEMVKSESEGVHLALRRSVSNKSRFEDA